jgi:hypothetical protein
MKKGFKAFVLLAISSGTIYALQPNSGYIDSLIEYLGGKNFPINGKFYSYDFNRNGKIDYNDWIYIDYGTNKAARL